MYVFQKDLMQGVSREGLQKVEIEILPDVLFVRDGDTFEGWTDFQRKYGESAGVRLDHRSLIENYLGRIGLFFEKDDDLYIIKTANDEAGKLLYEFYLENDEPAISTYSASWKGLNRENINNFLQRQPWLETEGRVSYAKYGFSQSTASSLWLAKPETNLYVAEEVNLCVEIPENSQWTVLKQYRVRGLTDPSRVYIQCSCGKIMRMYRSSHLQTSMSCKSCAGRTTDFQSFYRSIQQEKYTVVKGFQDERPTSGSRIWLQCSNGCDAYETHQSKWVNKGYRCPGCSFSVGEKKVAKYLDENGVEYRSQVKFDNLVGIGGGQLRYDFEIELNGEKILVEIDGGSHFKPTRFGGRSLAQSEEAFEIQQQQDHLKDLYASENDLRLIRIQNIDNNHEFILESLRKILEGSKNDRYGDLYLS